jgi:hypothetical protein
MIVNRIFGINYQILVMNFRQINVIQIVSSNWTSYPQQTSLRETHVSLWLISRQSNILQLRRIALVERIGWLTKLFVCTNRKTFLKKVWTECKMFTELWKCKTFMKHLLSNNVLFRVPLFRKSFLEVIWMLINSEMFRFIIREQGSLWYDQSDSDETMLIVLDHSVTTIIIDGLSPVWGLCQKRARREDW